MLSGINFFVYILLLYPRPICDMIFWPWMSLEVTGGHRRSKGGQIWKCNNGPNFWHSYSHYIPDQFCLWNFDLRSHERSPEFTGGQKEVKIEIFTQGLNFWHLCSYYILDQYCQWHFDLKSYKMSPEVTGGQKEVKIEMFTWGSHFWHAFSYDILDQHKL